MSAKDVAIEVVTGTAVDIDGNPEDIYDTFVGPQVSFMTEPSGALVIFQTPGQAWAAYAPGHWIKIRDGGSDGGS